MEIIGLLRLKGNVYSLSFPQPCFPQIFPFKTLNNVMIEGQNSQYDEKHNETLSVMLSSDYVEQCEHITGIAEWDKVLLDSVSDTF